MRQIYTLFSRKEKIKAVVRPSLPPLWIYICCSLRDSCSYGERQQADRAPPLILHASLHTLSIHQPSQSTGSFLQSHCFPWALISTHTLNSFHSINNVNKTKKYLVLVDSRKTDNVYKQRMCFSFMLMEFMEIVEGIFLGGSKRYWMN